MVTGYFIALNVTLTVVFSVIFTFAVVFPCCPSAISASVGVTVHVSTRYPVFAVAVKVISASFATLPPAGITGLAVIEPFAPALIVTVQPSVTGGVGGCTAILLNVTLTVVFAVTFTFAVVSSALPFSISAFDGVMDHLSIAYFLLLLGVAVKTTFFPFSTCAGEVIAFPSTVAVRSPFPPFTLNVTVNFSGCTSLPLFTFVLQPSTKAATSSAVAAKFKNVVFFLCMVFIRFSFKFLKFIIRKKIRIMHS